MSCIAEIGIAAIAEEIADCTVGAIGRQLCYIFQYKSNISNLQTETHNLGLEEQKMKELVDDAIRKGHAIFEITKNWQKDGEVISKQAKEILEDKNHANTGWCTFRGLLLLNLVPRYRLSKKAKRMCVSVVKIKGEVNFENISHRPHLQSDFTNKDYISFDSRNEIMDEILEALGDGNTRMIGVHGMPGAGKTTLVKEVSRRALELELFSEAVLVPVSNTPDVKNIQKSIAERLDLPLDKETIPERALLLRDRLQREKKFLIILDDVWKEVNLKDVGIVFEGDQKGCKILFTSRFGRVLQTDMGVDKIFKVGLLEKAEALNWFRAIVAQTVEKYSECADMVNDIVQECARLPITIETIACALKDRRQDIWQDVLNQLKNSNLRDINSEVNEKVFNSIELCYNYVHKEEAKSLFLLCSLHGEDESIRMEDLMRYGMGWGIFKQIHKLQDARFQVHSLIDELKDRALLLDGDHHHTVKMHDIVRDVAKSVARKSHIYCFTDDSEVRYLESEVLEKSKAILTPNGYVAELLREGLEYNQLKLIWMWKSKASQIPDKFFEITKNLRVLRLGSDECLEKLPSSLCFLGNLRTLILHCQNVEDISLIGGLKKLEILDLSKCGIKELPREVGKLPCLRMLDLRGCTRLKIIQPDIISNLKSLEELYVVNSFKYWDGQVQGVNRDQKNASLDELKLLKRLTTLHLEIVDIEVLPKDLFRSIKLEQYLISIGYFELTGWPIDDSSKCLKLRLDENKLLEDYGLEKLLASTQRLSLNGLQGAHNVVYELDKNGFPNLKYFKLENNLTIQRLVKSTEQIHPCSVFGSLETLQLDYLENLEKICDEKLTKESFKRLRIIKVSGCNMLKNLLPFSMSRLEEIEIIVCRMMEEIVSDPEEEEDMSKEVTGDFPQLRSLKLRNVPRLKSFCSKLKKIQRSEKGKQPMDVDNSVKTLLSGKLVFLPVLEELEVSACHDLTRLIWDDQILPCSASFHNLTTLLVEHCDSLEYLFSSAVATSFVQLRSLLLGHCWNMKEIVRNSENMVKVSFPKLNFLSIDNLECLTTFSSEIDIDFPVLTELYIEYCPEFSTFISKSEDEEPPSLFNEKVALPSLKNLKIGAMDKLKMIANNADVFRKLEVLEISRCYNVMKLFGSRTQRALGSLRWLDIKECARVEEVFEIQTSSFEEITHDTVSAQLIHLCLSDLPCLRYVWGKDPQGSITFPHLENVEAFSCPSLKSIFPFSIAKGASKLRKLSLSSCGIEQIVEALGTTVPVPPEFVFPQLEEMNLYHLENLVCIYPGLHLSSWPSLTTLVMKGCEKVKVLALELSCFQDKHAHHDHDNSPIPQVPLFFTNFDSFRNLEKLELLECNLEKIWDGDLLPNSRSFSKLTSFQVYRCGFLKNLFSSAVATNFKQLQSLEIEDCEMIEEIMSKNEKVDKVQFTGLKHLHFNNLPNFVSFSTEIFTEFPLLTGVSINRCPMFKSFVSKLEEKDCTTRTSLFNDKFDSFPNLEKLELLECNLEKIWDGELLPNSRSFSKLTSFQVYRCGFLKNLFSSAVAANFKQLQSLEIEDCEMIEEIMSKNDKVDKVHFTGLKHLHFNNLPNFVSFSTEIFTELPLLTEVSITGCDRFGSFLSKLSENYCTSLTSLYNDKLVFLPSFEELKLSSCHDLTRLIWDDQILPSPASFHNLTKLLVEFNFCLGYLVSSAVAASFLQLRSLVLRHCPNMKEIVRNSENMVKVSFPKLDFLSIDNLERLTTFSSEIDIDFPVLTELYIEYCPEFSTFISKSEDEELPSLFNEKVAFPSLKILRIIALYKLKMIVNDADVFRKLEISDCQRLTEIISDRLEGDHDTEDGEIVSSV